MKIVIIGAGQVGFYIAQRLSTEDKEVVVVDKNPEVLEHISNHMDVQTLEGSGSSPRVLEEAGIKQANILLAVTDSDETNLVACTFANILAPGITKLARIRNEEYLQYRDKWASDLSVSMVINPEVEVVRTIVRMMGMPGAVEINEFGKGRVKLVGMWVDKGTLLDGLQLYDLREKTGVDNVLLAAIVREDNLIIPSGEDRVLPGDLVYLACEDKDLKRISRLAGGAKKGKKDVLIVGGGNIGLRLARVLEKKGANVKLLENSIEVCKHLAEDLDRTTVLTGDGTDREVLEEENVGGMDLVVTLTGDEESNILSSLLASKMGAKMTITRINKMEYMPLVRTIGLKHIVNPRLSAVNTILNQVRRGSIVSSVALEKDAEAMEAVIEKGMEVAGKRIMDLPFPSQALVLAIMRREKVIVPSGETRLEAGDRIIIICTRKSIPAVEKKLTLKLEYY
jgi:trk system potassium uptake protein TrkA